MRGARTRILPGDGDSRHGSVNGYSNHYCRCDACKAAWAAEAIVVRSRRAQRLADADHGRSSTYLNWHCRCRPCTVAHTAYKRERRVGMTATPTADAHPHPSSLDAYHGTVTARDLRLHLFYSHDDQTSGLDFDALVERHRQAHASDEAIARGAQLGEAFAGLGRTIPEGAAVRRGGPSGQSAPAGSHGTRDEGGGGLPATTRPDPAAKIARAVMAAIAGVRLRPASDLPAIEADLAGSIRKALESYR